MTRLLLLIALQFTLLAAEAILERVTIAHQDFVMTTESYDIYSSKGKVMRFYKEARSGDMQYLFAFTLDDSTGTCSKKSVEKGAYEINGNKLTLYTLWDRRGGVDAPYGARIKEYIVEDRDMKLLSSRIYVETKRPKSEIPYLFKKPETKVEQKALKAYVKEAERHFKGTFVFDSEAKALISEVKETLRRDSAKRWR